MLQSNLYEMPLFCGLSTWRMPSAAVHSLSSILPVFVQTVILHFWVFCQLPLKDEEQERKHGAERKRCYSKKGRGQGRGTWREGERDDEVWDDERKENNIYMKSRQLWSIMSSLTDQIFSLLSSILLSSSPHRFGRSASIINMWLLFRWWTDIRPFHRWMQLQRRDFFLDLCPGGMVSHNTDIHILYWIFSILRMNWFSFCISFVFSSNWKLNERLKMQW